MKNFGIVCCVAFAAAIFSSPLWAEERLVDCGKDDSLKSAIRDASSGESVTFTGTCHENIEISKSGVTVIGYGTAIISPTDKARDALRIAGAQRVKLRHFTVQNGLNGIHATGNAGLTLKHVTAQNNAQTGILIEGSSAAYVSDCTTSGNGLYGIDAENSSSINFTGTFNTSGNAVFGMNVTNSSSATLSSATFSAANNVLGVQVSLSSGLLIADASSTLDASNNFTTGLTVVSGAHMVDFGGKIISNHNAINGISLFSRAGLDLDAASPVTADANGQDGVHLEELSTLNMFNTPAFSGAPGVTTLDVHGNAGNGISALLNSQVHMFNQTAISDTSNVGLGIQVDNGSSLTLLTSTVQSNHTDIDLTFGSRAEFTGNTVGTLTCDATSLIRGDTRKTCPAR